MKIEKRLRWIGYFFAGMLAFTFLSRAADSMTIPKVRVETTKKGSLNFNVEGGGNITSETEETIFLPAGGKTVSFAETGTSVKEGEDLAVFDVEALKEKEETMKAELRKLELAEEQQAVSGEPAGQVREQDAAGRTAAQKEEELNMLRQQLEGKRQEYQEKKESQPSEEEKETFEAEQRELETQIQDLEARAEEAGKVLMEAQNALSDARIRDENAQRDAERQKRASELARQGIQVDIEQKKKEINELDQLIAAGGRVVSPVSGTVTEATPVIGLETSGGEYLKLGTGNGQMTAEMEKEQASKLKEKDRITVTSPDGKKKAEGKIKKIRDVLNDEEGESREAKVKILADLSENEFQTGERVEFQAVMESKEYKTLIPLNALREDGEGRYVLILKEQGSILGKEMAAVRIPVKVLERDHSNAAVESALMKEDQIIVSSNKSIKADDRVRLE